MTKVLRPGDLVTFCAYAETYLVLHSKPYKHGLSKRWITLTCLVEGHIETILCVNVDDMHKVVRRSPNRET